MCLRLVGSALCCCCKLGLKCVCFFAFSTIGILIIVALVVYFCFFFYNKGLLGFYDGHHSRGQHNQYY